MPIYCVVMLLHNDAIYRHRLYAYAYILA